MNEGNGSGDFRNAPPNFSFMDASGRNIERKFGLSKGSIREDKNENHNDIR